MKRKVPLDAFEEYVAMGPSRSYAAMAEKHGVTKRAVSRLAIRERWSERLVEIERRAREKSDDKLTETLSAMRLRHLKTLRAVNARALAALKQYPLNSAMEAVRCVEIAIKLERQIALIPAEEDQGPRPVVVID